MPPPASIAVLDLELEELPTEVTGLGHGGVALALIRRDGRPVAEVRLSVSDGRIPSDELRGVLAERQLAPRSDVGAEPARWPGKRAELLPVTLAICTRDRPEHLRRCLDACMRFVDDGCEILVIDSCSTSDVTRRVVEVFPSARSVRDGAPGLHIAR